MASLREEIESRRTFAIISHPDAGKTTLTEKLLLYGGAIQTGIPTIISGIYGMNLDERWVPFAKVPFGFEIVCGIIVIICVITLWILHKKKML